MPKAVTVVNLPVPPSSSAVASLRNGPYCFSPASPIQSRSKLQKIDSCQTPSRSGDESFTTTFSWQSPFATQAADQPAMLDESSMSCTEELSPGGQAETRGLLGKMRRQPSLQDWCAVEPSAELSPKRSKSLASQTFELAPHGSPKLSRPGFPIFTPRTPKKAGSRSFAYGEDPITAFSTADRLSDLLSCDEDLNWSWAARDGPDLTEQLCQKSARVRSSPHLNGNFDSHSMKLLS